MRDADTRLIAHTLPYPVARAVCAMDAEPPHAPERKLRHLLFALESLLQLLGSVVLVDAYEQRHEPNVQACLKGLRRDHHLSLGLWQWVLTALARVLPDPFVPALSQRAAQDTFVARIARLTDARNQLSHPACAIDPAQARDRLAALRPDFDALVQSVRFLGGYHLVGVAEPATPVSQGSRAMLVPLRGRRIAPRDVPLTFASHVAHRDVLLVRPDLRAGLVLHPFFTLAPPGSADDVLVLNRFDDAGLRCYAAARPDVPLVEAPLRDDNDRAQTPWAWLKSSARRRLRVEVVSSGDSVSLDGMQRLRGQQHGSEALPLRELRHLATGGMAEVFVGLDPTSGLPRVMKVAQDPTDRGARQHILGEYKTLARVRHPGVVEVYTCPTVEGLGPCIVAELFDHPTLQEHLSHGGFEPAEVGVLLGRLLDAVAALHAAGVVHRDLKPANVLYDRASGAVKVIDLGIAQRRDATSHPTTRVGHGTPEIMAPEQMRGGEVSPATDVYALGLLARALYCGLPSLGWRHDDHSAAEIPAAMRPVLVRATREEADARYADARAMLAALEAAQQEPTTVTPSPFVSRELSQAERVRLSAEVVRIFRRSERRVSELRDIVSHTTDPEAFEKQLRAIFDETDAALYALMPPGCVSNTGPTPQQNERGGIPIAGGATELATRAIPLASMALAFLPIGLIGVTMAGAVAGAVKVNQVARRRQRLVDACDAATAALKDSRRTVLESIQAR